MKKRTGLMTGILFALLVLGGCGGGYDKGTMEEASVATQSTYDIAANDYKGEYQEETAEVYPEEAGVSASSGIASVSGVSQKLIKTVNLHMETREFDPLLSGITTKTQELGGYVESSEVSGDSYYGNSTRSAWLRLRIPAEKLDGFVEVMGEMGNVTYKEESVQDVTLEYVDVESHKQALTTEQERLLTLLESAENMEDIIQIETRLSEIRYELQSYESRLRVMDNQVQYSTVTLSIQEVERITEVKKKTFFEEIAGRFSDNLYDIGQGIRSFAIWFLSSLPYLLIWAGVIGLVVWLLRRKIFPRLPIKVKKEKEN